jgi:putative transposase
MAYHRRNHAKFLNLTHLVMVCKYRKRLLVPFGTVVKELMREIAARYGIDIVQMEVDKDHIHLLIDSKPTMSLLEIVRLFKQISTYRLWRMGIVRNYLNKCFWKEHTFWSDGYFVCSIGNANPATIQCYILNQG